MEERLFEVLSEEIETVIWEDFYNYYGHCEYYRIYKVVEAKSYGQAKWKVWKTDTSFTGKIIDMPKFSVKLYRRANNETC